MATDSSGNPVTLNAGSAGAQARSASLATWLRALRPEQWIKNGFVLSPLLFSGRALAWESQWRALAAFAAFCAVASAVYLLNDVVDRDADRQHPRKRNRPIASGLIAPGAAVGVATVLGLLGLVIGAVANVQVAIVLLAYFVLNLFYGSRLKHIVIVDVFSIAAFFVLRLLAGSVAIGVRPSIWLLLCGGLLALYLGFAKRRHELVLLGTASATHRSVLADYTTTFLDQLSVVLLSVTVVSYIMYTLESETARLVGTDALSYSTAFVLYGVLRYLYLVHRDEGGDPTGTLLTDRPLIIAVVLWGLYCGAVIYVAR
jgi:4-hydroxybenzoate polyprenyltransferase